MSSTSPDRALALSGLTLAGLIVLELTNDHILQAHETEDSERRQALAVA
jgi:hypothetical protein